MATQAQTEALERARAAKQAKAQQNSNTEPERETVQVSEPEQPVDPILQFADQLARDVTPGRAREEAQAARTRSHGSDPAQARLEAAFADRLTAIADAFESEQRRAEETQRIKSKSVIAGVTGGDPTNRPIPAHIKRGSIVLLNNDARLPDAFAIVLRLHPKVVVDGEAHRWRADLVQFPFNAAPGPITAVPFGPGVGQFREVPDDEDDIGVLGPDGVSRNDYDRPYESPLR